MVLHRYNMPASRFPAPAASQGLVVDNERRRRSCSDAATGGPTRNSTYQSLLVDAGN